MEKLYGVAELAERWGCTERTARERMRRIGAFGKPMKCRESAIDAWERHEMGTPAWMQPPGIPKGGKRQKNVFQIEQGPLKPGQFISRVRPKKMKEA